MATDSLIESERVKVSLALSEQDLMPNELRAGLILGGSFLAGAIALLAVAGVHGHVSLPITALYVLGLAAAAQLPFDFGASFTVPTQLVFVPMLFAEPVALVPLLVAVSLVLANVPAIVRGRLRPGRAIHALGNSWFALGPALVLSVLHAHHPESNAVILLGALLAQFAFDFAASAVHERLQQGISLRDLAEEIRPLYLIDASLAPVGLAVALGVEHHPWAPLLVAPLLGLLSVFGRERRSRLTQLIELNDAYRGTALVLGDVVEADDSYTGEHTRGVVELTMAVAARLGLNAHQQRNVEFGALLHDVGKVAVPKSIINKPGKLNDEEWAIIKQHTIEGQRMLETVGGFMKEVGRIVRSSHERWDGAGYPDGLVGEAIPLEARICSVCDAYNAMTTTRSYRAAMPVAEAVTELARCAGTQFDPRVVDALLAVVAGSEPAEPAGPGELTGSGEPIAVAKKGPDPGRREQPAPEVIEAPESASGVLLPTG